jgi:integrase
MEAELLASLRAVARRFIRSKYLLMSSAGSRPPVSPAKTNRKFLETVLVWPEPHGSGWINLHVNRKNNTGKNNGKLHIQTLNISSVLSMLPDCAAEGSRWADFFKILILTGARRDALCSMRRQDLDLTSGVWTVPATWSKNRREMAIPRAAAVISKALGHASPQSSKAYVHLDVEPARLAIEKALGGLGDAS